ncbi:hypothetical protein LY01_02254 [Nonlabens xylanidelens]|uniref:Uncharacterized protein n=1 Tax=Nonlabens xylanidelens TaxID=191564 RepID=A0A2S6III9_9FLAO|nr:hypothetical protein [Nonlabens xylanidelens]PPK94032.1 hypothetical protein LY01_02254 [Nonlabens xylanidelens]PQJ22186.1 hypothetical protein BST94_00990 [Nonlabens xylanidelens]
MKFFQKLSLVVVTFLLLNSFTITGEDVLVGKWKGTDKGEVGYFDFTPDGYVTFELGGQIMGGKSFSLEGMTAKSTYVVDRTQYPMTIDLIFTDLSTDSELARLLGIFEMNSKDEMHIAINFSGTIERPADFNNNDLILHRVK